MATPETGVPDSPIIRRPNDAELLEKLQRKRDEYRVRIRDLGEFTHPEQLIVMGLAQGSTHPLSTILKERLLGKVLDGETGEVSTYDFTKQTFEDPIFQQVDPSTLAQEMGNACVVIDSYCTGDTSKLIGGTGLS